MTVRGRQVKAKGGLSSSPSLRSRTLYYLVFISALASVSGFTLWLSQDRLVQSMTSVKDLLIPLDQIVVKTRTQLDLQSSELLLIAQNQTSLELSTLNRSLAKLPPSAMELFQWEERGELPDTLKNLLRSWIQSVKDYQKEYNTLQKVDSALALLSTIQHKTDLLHRSIERELSVQLLVLNRRLDQLRLLGTLSLLIIMLSAMIFVFFVRRWMKPLEETQQWFREDPKLRSLLPPLSYGKGYLSTPSEVKNLLEAIRFHLQTNQTQAQQLQERELHLKETERSMGTLFSALKHLVVYNDNLTQELVEKEKLASMSETAARLAHEIRNPLNSMNLKLELLRDEVSEELQPQVDKILSEIDRLDHMTENHLSNTKAHLQGSANKRQTLVLNDFLKDFVDSMKEEFTKHNIRFHLNLPAIEVHSLVDPHALQGALLNLVKNSWEACESRDPKIITIDLKDSEQRWVIGVNDNGLGFPQNYLNQPWKPFQSSKNQGSGLGLSTTFESLKNQGIQLRIQSPAGAYSSRVELEGHSLLFKKSMLQSIEEPLL